MSKEASRAPEDTCLPTYGTKTTIYSYFGDEMNLHSRHSHLRRARAGVMNIMHISIGVTKIAALRVPPLKGK